MSQIAGVVACGGTEDIRTVCYEYPKGESRSQPAPPVDSSESNPYDWRMSLRLGATVSSYSIRLRKKFSVFLSMK
jgi:hypothetical protein